MIMHVCKRRRGDKPLSTIISTLGRVYRPDPVVPEAMLAVLRGLDVPPAYIVATASARTPLTL